MPTTSCGSRRKSASGKDRAAAILRGLLRPPGVILCAVPPVAFAALILVFAADRTRCAAAYAVYGLSAYALIILLAAVPWLTRRAKSAVTRSGLVRKLLATEMGRRYLSDTAFRCGVGICRGMAANLACGLFRAAVGIGYGSAWMIALAVYDLALGAIRAYLIVGYCHRERYGVSYEYSRYRGAAWMLFLLNIPMGGMIVMMVRTNSGFSYPGYVIYLSALYTFYAAILSVVNLARARRLGSPILSAARVLNLVCAMMSVLGLQTAMISRFSSGGEAYRRFMNALTGGFVYAMVVILAAHMLIRCMLIRKKWTAHEQS